MYTFVVNLYRVVTLYSWRNLKTRYNKEFARKFDLREMKKSSQLRTALLYENMRISGCVSGSSIPAETCLRARRHLPTYLLKYDNIGS